MKQIYILDWGVALIDDQDFEVAKPYTWFLNKDGQPATFIEGQEVSMAELFDEYGNEPD